MSKQEKDLSSTAPTITEADKQSISQLMDGALSQSETKVFIERLKHEPLLRDYWRSLHLISGVLQSGSLADWLQADIGMAVSSYHEKTKIILQNHESEQEIVKKQGNE